jgi:hypothetical protein
MTAAAVKVRLALEQSFPTGQPGTGLDGLIPEVQPARNIITITMKTNPACFAFIIFLLQWNRKAGYCL